MTQLYVKQGGNFVETVPFVKTGGTWKRAIRICIKLDGRWICDFTPLRSCGLYDHDGANRVKFNAGIDAYFGVDTSGNLVEHKIEFPILTKDVSVAFAKGDGAGSMIDAAPVQNHYINMWLVRETATGDLDYMTEAGPDLTLPAGWEELIYIGAVFWSSKLEPFVTQIEHGQLRMKLVHAWQAPGAHAKAGNRYGRNRNTTFDASPYIPPQIWGVAGGPYHRCDQTPGWGSSCVWQGGGNYAAIDGRRYSGNNPLDLRGADLTKGLVHAHGAPSGWQHQYWRLADYIIQNSDCDPNFIKGDFIYDNPSGEIIHFPTGVAEPQSGRINLPELSKDISQPWAPGDNSGGLVGTVKDDHWVLLLAITDGAGAVDYMATSTTPIAPPAGWSIISSVGMVYRTTSIVPFTVSTEDERCVVTFQQPIDLGVTVVAPPAATVYPSSYHRVQKATDLTTYVPPTPYVYKMRDASSRACTRQNPGMVHCGFYASAFGVFRGDGLFRQIDKRTYAFLEGTDLTKINFHATGNHTGEFTAHVKIGAVYVNRTFK